MSLFIYNDKFPSHINDNIKLIEFRCKLCNFDVCENINNLDCECDTLVFLYKISQNLSDLNNKITNIKFYVHSESLNSLPQHLENLYLCFPIKKNITNLPANLQNIYFMSAQNSEIKNIIKYLTKIPHNCNLFITDEDPKCKKMTQYNYKKVIV